jgi:hypothetical protein
VITYKVRSRALVDLVNDVANGKIVLSPYFQRKLVWRLAHKIDFIKTILLGYPFPEIFLARGKIDVEMMTSTSWVVDGQQRLTSIKQFVVDDAFEVDGRRFSQMTAAEKEEFLKYEVAVIDLDLSHDDAQVIEIFKRLNRTFYALSNIEKQATEFASSEFMLVAKLLCGELQDEAGVHNVDPSFAAGEDPNVSPIFAKWANSTRIEAYRGYVLESEIFTKQEIARQVHLAYTLNVMSTALVGFYNRNDAVRDHLELYAESFPERDELVERVNAAAKAIRSLRLKQKAFWYSKSNSFSLLKVMYDYVPRLDRVDLKRLKGELEAFSKMPSAEYSLAAKEAVNNKRERTVRAQHIEKLFAASVQEPLF